MNARYVLIIENLLDPIGFGIKRATVILVDTHSVSPILDGTIAIENQPDIEKMVSQLYGHDLKIIKP